MATYNLGQVAIVSKGAWSSSVNYAALNTVTHNSGSFMATAPNSNVEPGVTSGWESYWVSMAKGIKTVTVTAVDASTAQMTVTFSDGSTVTSGTFGTASVGTNSVNTAAIQEHAVTAVKLGTDIKPEHVGIVMGTGTPTTASPIISPGQIYLKYTE